jgi:hypothetical protein
MTKCRVVGLSTRRLGFLVCYGRADAADPVFNSAELYLDRALHSCIILP